jgi:TPR repeat protein
MKSVQQIIVIFCILNLLFLPQPSVAGRIDELSSMAKQGQVEAQFALAEAYYFANGIEKNLHQALFWYERAAQQGHPRAQRALGAMYELGNGTAKEPQKAAYWYQKSAEQGLARAQTNLGILYETGVGVENNYDTARLWYEKAAAQDYARGQTYLGRMYELGTGVKVDYTKAFYWYQKAADQNYLRAQTNLGALYESGRGVEQSYAKAIALYTKAAEQNYARAQFYLGRMFEQGVGVEKDVAQASKWYSQAAALGHVKARKQLAKVVSELSRTNEKIILEEQEAVDQVAEKTENYNSQRAAKLYQLIIAERQRRENVNQGSVYRNEVSENAPKEIPATAVMNPVADKNKKDIYARVTTLQLEIERLTERIDSGLSDRDYARYMQLKSPVFVIHDSERLEAYQTELDKLLLEMTSQ